MRCVRSILYSIEKRGKGKGREFLYKDSKNYPSPPSPPSLGVEMVARTHMCIKLLKVYAGCRLPGCGDARCPLSLLTLDPVTIVARRCRLDISRRRGKPEKSVKIPHAIRIPLLRHCAALIQRSSSEYSATSNPSIS